MHDGATIARFVTTGLATAILLFALTWSFTAGGLPPFVGGTLAYAVCFAFAYLAQRGWAFGGRHGHRQALPRYFVAQAAAGLTSGAAVQVASSIGFEVEAAAAIATVAASAMSFLLSLFWVFPARVGIAER